MPAYLLGVCKITKKVPVLHISYHEAHKSHFSSQTNSCPNIFHAILPKKIVFQTLGPSTILFKNLLSNIYADKLGAQKVHWCWQGTPLRILADNTHTHTHTSNFQRSLIILHLKIYISSQGCWLFCRFFLCIFVELLLCFHNCFLCTCTRITKAWR